MFLRLLTKLIFVFSFAVGAMPDETPRVISGQGIIDVDENTEFVANFIYQDGDGDHMTLSLEGEDETLFAISNQGELRFVAAPDYEQPDDANKNNTYVLRVNARDKTGAPFAIDLSVNVAPVNEAPVLTSRLFHELTEDHVFELQLTVSEQEGDEFSISLTGDDAELFQVSDDQTLSMNILPNYEIPSDQDGNNVYQVSVVLTDELDSSETFEISLTVLDRHEQGYFSGVTKLEVAELSAKNGEQAALLSDVTWIEPDNTFNNQTLFITNLLPEDSLTIRSAPEYELNVDAVTGAVTYQGATIANIDLNATGQDGENFRVSFNQNTDQTSANILLDNLVYENDELIPTMSRKLKAVLVDSQGLLSAIQSEFQFELSQNSDVDLKGHPAGSPALADLDMDGKLDLVLGTPLGQLHTYLNTAEAGQWTFESNEQTSGYLTEFDVGSNAAPSFIDIDGDGDLDVFVGNASGFVSYFENTTSGSSVSFVARLAGDNPLSQVDVGDNAQLAFVDIDDDGDKDVFIGNLTGQVSYFLNQGTKVEPDFVFSENSPLSVELIGSNLTLVFADIDSDGDQDGVIANDQGQLHLFKNAGSTRTPSFISGDAIVNPFADVVFQGASKPLVLDIDSDLDKDLWVYDASQKFNALVNDSGLLLEVVWRENQAPEIEHVSQLDVIENLPINISPVVTDEEGDDISYKWQQVSGEPVTLVIDNQAELNFSSPAVEAETHISFNLTVTDGRDENSQDILVRVFPTGTRIDGFHLPEITLPDSVSVNENEAVNLSAIVTDEDAQTLTLSWELISGPSIELQGADTLTPSFIAPEVNEDTALVLQLLVSDGVFDVQKIISIHVMNTGEPSVPEVPSESEEDDSADLFGLSLHGFHLLFFSLVLIYRRRKINTL